MKSDDTLDAAIETARKAGNLLNRLLGKKRKISYKGAVDLITDVDKESQSLIAGHLQRIFPSHDVLAEEELSSEKGSEFLWLVDPLDGTTNYAHGFPVFCVSIALEQRGEIVTGVVYDPARDEMFSARKGKGAALNGKALTVSKEGRLGRSLIATGFPYDIRESEVNNLDHFARMAVRAQAIRRCGSAALDLCYTACGRFDGFWEMKLAPWDMAAGALIVSEAGGRITDFAGNPFCHDGNEILATNGLIHEQMISVLKQGKRE
ncbi:MAG: inositol monophosphatase family protein [Candidatus Aminicenantaceae bacterium]